jgi:hypothetical protein
VLNVGTQKGLDLNPQSLRVDLAAEHQLLRILRRENSIDS